MSHFSTSSQCHVDVIHQLPVVETGVEIRISETGVLQDKEVMDGRGMMKVGNGLEALVDLTLGLLAAIIGTGRTLSLTRILGKRLHPTRPTERISKSILITLNSISLVTSTTM